MDGQASIDSLGIQTALLGRRTFRRCLLAFTYWLYQITLAIYPLTYPSLIDSPNCLTYLVTIARTLAETDHGIARLDLFSTAITYETHLDGMEGRNHLTCFHSSTCLNKNASSRPRWIWSIPRPMPTTGSIIINTPSDNLFRIYGPAWPYCFRNE
jgi:hypothetical protein